MPIVAPFCSVETPAFLVRPQLPPLEYVATWWYDQELVCAAQLMFHNAWKDGSAINWTFARTLVHFGLHSQAGIGDVQLHPREGNWLVVELDSPDGHAELWLPSQRAEEYLVLTYRTVPPEREFDFLDLDHVISRLLAVQ